MGTRIGLICLGCLILAVALASRRPHAGGAAVILVEEVDASVFDNILMHSFSPGEEEIIRRALLPKFGGRCEEAFTRAGLSSPRKMASDGGFVIQYSRDLYTERAAALGLIYEETRHIYQLEFSSGRAQAGTVPFIRHGTVLTADGMPHIFLHDKAFVGESFWLGTLSLDDTLTHELIHAGGQPPTPGWLGFLSHDLAGFEHYDEILEACR